jgi:hypothetical protein
MTVKVSTSIQDLTGKGMEYLVDKQDNDLVRAIFIDGNLIDSDFNPIPNEDETLGL